MASSKVASAHLELELSLAKFKSSVNEAQQEVRKFSAQTRAEMEGARGSIRILSEELGVGMPRALQSFVAKLPGVTTAMNAAFSAVAVFALIEVVVKAGEKIAEFTSKADAAAQKNAESFRQLTGSLVKTNAELQVGNDRLEISIAKLSGKPVNNLKLSLDEAKLAAIELADKLANAASKERELIEAQNPNWFRREVLSVAGTDSVKEGYDSYQGRLASTNADFDKRVAAAPTEKAALAIEDQRKTAILKVQQDYYNALTKEIGLRQEMASLLDKSNRGVALTPQQNDRFKELNGLFSPSHTNGDQSEILQALQRVQGITGLHATETQRDVHRDQLQSQENVLQAAKDATEQSKQAIEAVKSSPAFKTYLASEEQKVDAGASKYMPTLEQAKADPGVAAAWTQNKDDLEYAGKSTTLARLIADEQAKKQTVFTQQIIIALKALQERLQNEHAQTTVRDQSAAIVKYNTDNQEAQRRASEEATQEAKRLAESMHKLREETIKSEEAFHEIGSKWAQLKNTEAFDLGHETKTQYIQNQKTLIDKEYYDEIAKIKQEFENALQKMTEDQERNAAFQNKDPNDPERKAASQKYDQERNALFQKMNLDRMTAGLVWRMALYKNEAEAFGSTWRGQIDSVFDEFRVKSLQVPQQFHDAFKDSIDGVNDELSKLMTGQKTSWSKMFQGLAAGFSKKGLEDLEGGLFGALNLGTKKTAAQNQTEQGAKAGLAMLGDNNVGSQIDKLDGLGNDHGSGVFDKLKGMFKHKPETASKGTSPGNPMYVSVVGATEFHGTSGNPNNPISPQSSKGSAAGNGADDVADQITSMVPGAGLANPFLNGIFGHFALGGDVMAGVPIDVGELGRERFVPSVPGRIIPNNQLGNGGPSIGYIDARGTDPVQTGMAVHRAMIATHRQAVRDASLVTAERVRRTPR